MEGFLGRPTSLGEAGETQCECWRVGVGGFMLVCRRDSEVVWLGLGRGKQCVSKRL